MTPLLGQTVVDIQPGAIELTDAAGERTRIATRTVVWAAGVTASPLAEMLAGAIGATVDRAGRVLVEPDLTLPGHPEVLALGDMVAVRDAGTGDATPLPGLAPVAIQQGRFAARLIRARLAGHQQRTFHYRDKGSLATIGRARAVAQIGPLRLSGLVAWTLWLVVHIYYLIGFENRAVVLLRWSYSFFSHGRGTRLITEAAGARPGERD